MRENKNTPFIKIKTHGNMKKSQPINFEKTQSKTTKILKQTPWLLICLICLFQFSEISAQRIVLDIRDAETFRPLADAEVQIQSFSSITTHYSSTDGSIIANVSQGAYTITINRFGYDKQVLDNVTVTRDQITRLEVLLERQKDSGTGTATQKSLISATGISKNLFADVGGQIGNLNAAGIGIGYYFIPEAFIMVNYAFSRQQYSSLFFINPEEGYRINFNRLSLSSGIDFGFKVINDIGLQFNPHMNIGFERANNKDLIDNDRIEYIMSYSFIAGMDIGVTYSRAVFYVGYNHAFWMFAAMNQERTPLENGITGETARWADDLFPGRKGRNIRIGVKLYL